MAAVTGNLELDEPDRPQSCAVPGLGGARTCLPNMAAIHANLTRQLWIRRTLEDLYDGVKVQVMTGKQAGLKPSSELYDELGIFVDRPLNKWDIPYMIDVRDGRQWYPLLSTTSKMNCPSWDLPSGPPALGGSCPAAVMAQAVVPLRVRQEAAEALRFDLNLDRGTCAACYATSVNFSSPSNALGYILRLWWTRGLIGANPGNWLGVMVDAINRGNKRLARKDLQQMADPRTGKPPFKPFRVHSSGDFYSKAYAAAWVQLVNELPEYIFWAPTRSWAHHGWEDDAQNQHTVSAWAQLLVHVKHDNLVVRPSGFHFGDAAPSRHYGFDKLRFKPKTYPYAEGTCSIYKPGVRGVDDTAKGQGVDSRYDFQCPVYNLKKDATHSCTHAPAVLPDGQQLPHCRVCWTHPHLRVNFMAH